jgi:hypothetical protein
MLWCRFPKFVLHCEPPTFTNFEKSHGHKQIETARHPLSRKFSTKAQDQETGGSPEK